MSLETASYVANLVQTNPDGGDQRSTADDHIRLIKAALKRTFPQLDAAVSLSSVQFAFVNDVTQSVQLQLNNLRDGSATANAAVNSRYANSASLALYANSASFALIAATANSASYATLAGQASSASYATLAATANSASYAALAGNANYANSASYAAIAGTAATATTATTATSATTAGSATTATTASNANALSGLSASTAAGANTIAARDSNGHLFAGYFNQSSSNNENPTPSQVIVTNGSDNYLRKSSLANLGGNLSSQNITGRTGTSKTLTSGSGPPSLSGSSNGDLFYYY
jgi:hypothetical protein